MNIMGAKVLTGPNSFALKQALNEIKAEFVRQHGDLAVEVIDGEEASYEQIISALESVAFLVEKKLVIVQALSSNKEAVEKIEKLIEAAQTGNDLVIVETKLDKRGAYYKYLKKDTDLNEFTELDERELANWLVEEAKARDAKLNFGDAYYLVQRIGANQRVASNELKKLIDYDKQISRSSIDLLTEASPQTNIFNLLDSAFSGDNKKLLKIYDEQRTQGEEPLKIFAMLTWQLHLVALVEAAGDRTDNEIMQASGLKPFTLNKSKSIARRMGRQKIKMTLQRLTQLDKQLKTTSVDADDALKNLLLSISPDASVGAPTSDI